MPFLASIEGNFGYGQQPSISIATSGLLVNLDAGNPASYPGTGITWSNLAYPTSNATLQNGPTYNSGSNGYITFNDTTFQYANLANLGNLTQWTIEAWARTTKSLSSRATALICNQFDLVNKLNYSLGLNTAYGSANVCTGFYDGAWRTTTGFLPAQNTWIQFLGTYNGATLSNFSNTVINTTLTYAGTPQSGGEVRIMRRWDDVANNNTNYYPGDLAIIRIYNRALTSAEITQNFNANRGRFGL